MDGRLLVRAVRRGGRRRRRKKEKRRVVMTVLVALIAGRGRSSHLRGKK